MQVKVCKQPLVAVQFTLSTLASMSRHCDVPVAHDVWPVRQSAGEQPTPLVQPTHAPLRQTLFVPQFVPFFAATCVSLHWTCPCTHATDP